MVRAEGGVGRIVDILVPLRGVLDPECGVADRLKDVLVEGEGRPDQRDADTGFGTLLHEGDAHAAGQEEEDAVRAARADPRDPGGVVGLAEPGIDLARRSTFIKALVAGDGVGAGGIVRRELKAVADVDPEPRAAARSFAGWRRRAAPAPARRFALHPRRDFP